MCQLKEDHLMLKLKVMFYKFHLKIVPQGKVGEKQAAYQKLGFGAGETSERRLSSPESAEGISKPSERVMRRFSCGYISTASAELSFALPPFRWP